MHAKRRWFPRVVAAVCLGSAMLGGSLAYAKLSGGGSTGFSVGTNIKLTVSGSTGRTSVSESGGNVTVTVNVASLKTGNNTRDEHMRNALQTSSYPDSTLVVSRSSLSFPSSGCTDNKSATGRYTLKGVEVSKTFTYKACKEDGKYKVTGSMMVNMPQHGVTPPTYKVAGVTVAEVKPDASVWISFTADDS